MKRLLVKKQGRIIPELTAAVPTSGIISVGSDASATIELAGGAVAPEQFVVVCEGDQLTLLCRVDGTEINGARLPKGSLHNLEPGDTIKVGDYTLTLESAETENETATGAEDRPAAAGPTAPEAAAPETETVSVAAAEEPAAERPASEKEPDRGAFEPDKSLSDVLDALKPE
jgi:predicted component of type VI protein secretion system